jgi:hypothetical protein
LSGHSLLAASHTATSTLQTHLHITLSVHRLPHRIHIKQLAGPPPPPHTHTHTTPSPHLQLTPTWRSMPIRHLVSSALTALSSICTNMVPVPCPNTMYAVAPLPLPPWPGHTLCDMPSLRTLLTATNLCDIIAKDSFAHSPG